MRRIITTVVAVSAGVVFSASCQAGFISMGFASSPSAVLRFNGNDPVGGTGTFSFVPSGGFSIMITNSDGTGDAIGLFGNITGTFDIGAITISGPVQSASVGGAGMLSIADGSGGFLTADLHWVDIQTIGTGGSTNSLAKVNLSNIAYSGATIADLTDLAEHPNGIVTVTFQFIPAKTLTQLTANGVTSNANSFSGSIVETPEPSGLALMLSMLPVLAGGVAVRRRRRTAQIAA
jgi:hypothetical protein